MLMVCGLLEASMEYQFKASQGCNKMNNGDALPFLNNIYGFAAYNCFLDEMFTADQTNNNLCSPQADVPSSWKFARSPVEPEL